jgi:hypothetical protein
VSHAFEDQAAAFHFSEQLMRTNIEDEERIAAANFLEPKPNTLELL